jgi:hypothetical protein
MWNDIPTAIEMPKESPTLQNPEDWTPVKDVIISRHEKLPENVLSQLVNKKPQEIHRRLECIRNDNNPTAYSFQLVSPAASSMDCTRCGLVVPSSQTGREVCKQTGWCTSCCQSSVLIHDDLLRKGHVARSVAVQE